MSVARHSGPTSSRPWSVGSAALALALCGCSDSPRPDTQWGSARLTWTVGTAAAGVGCTTLGASRFVALLITRGDLVDRYEAACGASSLDAPMLVAGDDYTVSASLQDDRGTPKTNALVSSPFSVEPGAVTRVEIHFGADAWIAVEMEAGSGADGG